MSDPSPVLIEVLRGEAVESRHRGAFAVVDAQGRVVAQAGAIDRPVFPRSAVKCMQAIPLLESGAAERLSDARIALSCASHRGEPAHVEGVRSWLAAAGLGPADLECGTHPPMDPSAAATLVRSGERPSPVHNNCSGKHTGFLSTAVHLGEEPAGYIRPDHPVQRRVAEALSDLTGTDLARVPCGCDGCGIPAYALPLQAIARGMARMVDRATLGPLRARAAERIVGAMAAEPFLVEGTGSFATDVMRTAGSTVCAKAGAEGVFTAALPRLGFGIALKIEDGASRAAALALATLLDSLGCFSPEQRLELTPWLAPVIHNVAGVPVGALRPTDAFSALRKAGAFA